MSSPTPTYQREMERLSALDIQAKSELAALRSTSPRAATEEAEIMALFCDEREAAKDQLGDLAHRQQLYDLVTEETKQKAEAARLQMREFTDSTFAHLDRLNYEKDVRIAALEATSKDKDRVIASQEAELRVYRDAHCKQRRELDDYVALHEAATKRRRGDDEAADGCVDDYAARMCADFMGRVPGVRAYRVIPP